jgi:subtilisin family serine protease
MQHARSLRTIVATILAAAMVPAALALGGASPAAAASSADHTLQGSGLQLAVVPKTSSVSVATIDPALLKAVGQGRSVDAIVSVDEGAAVAAVAARTLGRSAEPAGVRDQTNSLKANAFAASGVSVVRSFDHLPVSVVSVSTEGQLRALAAQPGVGSIHAVGTGTVTAAQSDPQSLALVRQPAAAAAGNTGTGTYVAVLDTGVDYRQPALGSCTAANTPATTCRVFFTHDYAPDDSALDDDGHGTNVSGIIANTAPGTRIFGLDVFHQVWDSARGTWAARYDDTSVLAALNDVVIWKQQGYNIRAVNLSLGVQSTYFTGTCSSAYTDVFSRLRSNGILPVVAAGNEAETDLGYQDGIGTPACTAGAFSVGAVFDSNLGAGDQWCNTISSAADQPACFSQSSPQLSLFAPGLVVDAAGIQKAGTSQATPHVAAAAAILAAARPTATVAQVESALKSAGPVLHDPRFADRATHRLDIPGAVSALTGTGDVTAPSVSQPSSVPTLGSSTGTATVPYTFSWSATDAGGVAGYAAYLSTNAGAFSAVTLPSPTATSLVLNLTPGNTYQLAVQARDTAGNWSTHAYSRSSAIAQFPETSTYATYAGTWTQSSWAPAYGGAIKVTSQSGASVSFTFTGTSLAWVATKATNRGKATVYLDGVNQGTWDLYSATTQARAIALAWKASAPETHTLKIVDQATAGRPNIDVDAFVLGG